MTRLASRAARLVAAAATAAGAIPKASLAAVSISAAALAAPWAMAAPASPLDPAAPAAMLPDRQGMGGSYRPLPALEPLPWRGLFDADGGFVDHDRPAAAAQPVRAPVAQPDRAPLAQAHAASGHHGPGSTDQAAGQSPPAGADGALAGADGVPAGADGVATVLRIDRDAQRVRLRHGPIRKFEMPGMTMLFQVSDPALLDAVAVGDTIGFRVEQRGQAFVITDWMREGAK